MWKYTVAVKGMMCGMCEAHVNDAVRRVFAVKKVSSSHNKGETAILSGEELDMARLKEAVEAAGYQVGEIKKEPYHKSGLFGRRS